MDIDDVKRLLTALFVLISAHITPLKEEEYWYIRQQHHELKPE